MDNEVDPVYEAEQTFQAAEQAVRRLASDLELSEAELAIARIRLARAKQDEGSNRGR